MTNSRTTTAAMIPNTFTHRGPTVVPKLWNATIEGHRREVRDAILDTAAALAAEHGLTAVTMSQIAEGPGSVGRRSTSTSQVSKQSSWPGTNARSPTTSTT